MIDTIDRAVGYLAGCQSESGSLRGDYDGPLFLTPGYVFAHHATGTPIPAPERAALRAHLERVQNADGGFGLHLEGPSILFSTVLNHVALRLLGAESPRALAWIRACGGAVAIPSWGKCWLAIMRLYDWGGVSPLPPELWLQPRWSPVHPRRFWCHARVIYLPLSYLYGRRWQVPETPLIASIREELFPRVPDWRRARAVVRAEEVHAPRRLPLRLLDAALARLEPRAPSRLRARALAEVLDHVEHEEATTDFIAIGPISTALDAIALHAAGSSLARPSMEGLRHYLFDGERGLTMSAEDSSELWDTALAVQALVAAGHGEGQLVGGARRTLLAGQIRDDVPDRRRYYRDRSRGGWPFSTRRQGWPVSDCTAEALSALLPLGGLEHARLVDAVDLVLGWQNRDGGWAVYERRRAHPWLELLNASELFAGAMTDRSYVELTGSALCALVAARPLVDARRDRRIVRALRRGERYLRRHQRPDGSWEGSWGICFTYGTWFAVRGLRAAGVGTDDPALRRAVEFLLAKQLPGGGWGESWESCPRRAYLHHPEGSQPVMTAWALLALLQSGTRTADDAIARGVRFLRDCQLPDGDWPQRSVTGVFNRTCMLHYRFYRNVFPIWALALAAGREES